MGIHEELDALLAQPECHAILVNALGDYIGDLEAKCEGHDAEAAYFQRSIRLAEALCDVFYRWP